MLSILMTHQDTILAFLHTAAGPICDDCLSSRTKIVPRQTVNLNCRRLSVALAIARAQMTDCHYCRLPKICSFIGARGQPLPAPLPQALPPRSHSLWHWEGNVQSVLVQWLTSDGWDIRSAADTAAKTRGKDIIAKRGDHDLWVSVKGYPAGTQKTTPSTQARHWFAKAVFDLVMYRDESSCALLALGLPDFATYRNLSKRTQWLRSHLPFTIYWVDESGAVRFT